MSRKVMMGSRSWGVAAGLLLATCLSQPAAGWPNNGLPMIPQEATNPIDYLNLMGYEGIPHFGIRTLFHGPPPPVADWVTTHCRFIDAVGVDPNDHILRYSLHLPDRARIGIIQLRVADFADTGQLWIYLYRRRWNSRDPGDLMAFRISSNLTLSDQVINMPNLNHEVDNTNYSYWIDVETRGTYTPGALCVYSIHVPYIPRLFADGFESGDTGDWTSSIP